MCVMIHICLIMLMANRSCRVVLCMSCNMSLACESEGVGYVKMVDGNGEGSSVKSVHNGPAGSGERRTRGLGPRD